MDNPPKIIVKLKPKTTAPKLVVKIKLGVKPQSLARRIDLPHGQSWLEVYPQLPLDLCMDSKTYARVWDLHPSELAQGMMFGHMKTFPRYTQAYEYNYKFSGTDHPNQPLTDEFLIKLLNYARLGFPVGAKLGVLINWYRDGDDYIGPHSDNEKHLIKGSPIYSFSFVSDINDPGAIRTFVVESNPKKCGPGYPSHTELPMAHNSLIKMCGQTQMYYKHSVPKLLTTKSRINVTIRQFA